MESLSKAETLREILDGMLKEEYAQFIEEHNLVDKLINKHRKNLAKWEFPPVDCKAPAINQNGQTVDLEGQVAFKPKDDFHSNQGRSGLCARHAVAKALLQSWRDKFARKQPMNLQMMIAFLITSLPKGSKSAKVTDFKTVQGQIADPATQRVYYMEIYIRAVNDGNILVLDMSKVFPGRYDESVYHAVCQ